MEILSLAITLLVFGFSGTLIVLKVKKKTSVANIIIYSVLAVLFLLFDSSTNLFAIYNFEIMINQVIGSIMIGAVVGSIILLRRDKLSEVNSQN
jgi:hypothetical protein